MIENEEELKKTYMHFGMEPCFTNDHLLNKLNSLGIIGKAIKDIKFTDSNHSYVIPYLCRSLKEYSKMPERFKKWITKCYARTDWPILIKFEDDSILSIYSCTDDDDKYCMYYVGLNTLLWENQYDDWWEERIEDITSTNFNADVLFGRIMKMKISGFETSDNSLISSTGYVICLESESKPYEQLKLHFSDDGFGYCDFELLDKNNNILEIREEQIPALFAGYEDWTDN